MNCLSNTTTAIVLGLSETGLSVARALGRRRIEVIGVSPEWVPATFSRYLKYIKEPATDDEDRRLEFFVQLGRRFKSRPVILPTFDPNVMFLSKYRKILDQYFNFLLPDHNLLKSITSKLGLVDIAHKYQIPLPCSIRINKPSDLKKIPSDIFPCMLKPEFHDMWLTEKAIKVGIGSLKAIPAINKAELREKYDRICKVDPAVIAQKMIVGPDENHLDYHALTDADGRIIAEFVGKKLRLTPPHFGMGCYVESVKSNEVVHEGRRILRALNYTGMANINFKKDNRDGRLYFFELNPRFSFWTGLDVACGVDFPYYYYKTCLGEKIVGEKNYLLGKKWISLTHDVGGLRTAIKDGSMNWKKWLLSVINADVGALFAKEDPLPAIIQPLHIFRWILRNFFKIQK